MARLNALVQAFETGKPCVGRTLPCGDLHAARRAGESDFDFVMVDFEHEGFDFPALGQTLQWLISRRQMQRRGMLCPPPTPIVRIPANGGEHTEWIVKQVLDYGAFGIVLPHVRCGDDARAAIAGARYSQGPEGVGPEGHRGVWPDLAPRYWGAERFEDYVRLADLWPLAPEGEMLVLALVEDSRGFERIDEIVAVEGLGGVLFGPGDGMMSLGGRGAWDPEMPALVEARRKVVRACRESCVPCGFIGARDEGLGQLVDEGFSFFITSATERPEITALTDQRPDA